jgi:Leucine-rich repeat (LRR) protein
VFDVISRISSLRELKLAENNLLATLPASISALTALEVLDLHTNKLTSLPIEIRLLTSLRTLNVSSNQLRSIPAELFGSKLLELQAARNKLDGSLFTSGTFPYLQELNVSNNTLTRLCDGDSIDLPALRVLNLSTNRVELLPNMDTWVNMRTLIMAENKLTMLPPSIYALRLQTLDITANDITILDERMALMPLEKLIVAANPLREKKFLTMSPEDIQRVLASRLTVEEPTTIEGGPVSAHENASTLGTDGWQITPAGMLDLSFHGLTETLDEASLEASAAEIRHLNLQSNAFESIPGALSRLTHLAVLDLSKNNIATALSSALDLPKLRELRLTGNKLTSLTHLTTHLSAPTLQTLDISNNRLSGPLPVLRYVFPGLISLIACDNRISEVSVEALTGLKTVNLSNNDIERLEPMIGLLAGTLTALNVEGNKFRVPSYHVLQRGTDTVLAWLRDKVPLEDMPGSDVDAEGV